MSNKDQDGLTRREGLVLGAAGAAGLAGLAAEASGAGPRPSHGNRLPVVYLPHGGGPWPFVEMGLSGDPGYAPLIRYLRSIRELPKAKVKALLVISAHWEEPVPTVMSAERPPMFYDYYGFPPESYSLEWPAPGHPELAGRVQKLLEGAGFKTARDAQRGFDHGTFVPLKLSYPEAELPTVQLSLKRGLDPIEHLAMGRALAPLREEGIFIVGSGMSYHDLRAFFRPGAARAPSEVFDTWLQQTAALEEKARDAQLAEWAKAPGARQAHPREEHLLPLMVIAGAAGADRGKIAYSDHFMGAKLSAVEFG